MHIVMSIISTNMRNKIVSLDDLTKALKAANYFCLFIHHPGLLPVAPFTNMV